MKERNFIGFKVAAITTLAILLFALAQYIFLHFGKHQLQNNIWANLLSCFVLLLLIIFQILNMKMFSYIEKQDYPILAFIRLHTFLLIINAFCIVLLLLGTAQLFVWRNTLIYRNTNVNLGLLFCLILFVANSITIISSLRLRKYLRQQYEVKGQYLLESFGKNEI